ncbi:acetate/propionate family kinase [Rhodopirellula halodulae]|uniref:acetate/propionate family kinase n=1 Tax=Rhodopirellula halodulae TaxID=2894198 RepID=UPI001E2E765D|nr:acetate kinase [Rhodopirellula sp. JC737]MCC9655051.1 acetate kinase [Rhodopirellula sp. JC737]
MIVLSLNPGSGSLRYRLVDTTGDLTSLPSGMVDRIVGEDRLAEETKSLLKRLPWEIVDAIAVRCVHGGRYWAIPACKMTPEVLRHLESIFPLAPLHLPSDVAVARTVMQSTDKPVHAVFDSSFHRTIDEVHWRYPIPYDLGEEYRSIGFHGLAHESVALAWAKLSSSGGNGQHAPSHGSKWLSLHFGGGASACAVVDGESRWTTMGMTPLDGLMMSTRSGSIDPAIVLSMIRDGRSPDEVERLLNRESGLKGVSGISEDTRDLLPAAAEGDVRPRLALEMYANRVRQTVGAGIAVMGGCDALLLSGALVKDSAEFRHRLLNGLDCFGIHLDDRKNDRDDELREVTELSSRHSSTSIAFVPADEEKQMARMVEMCEWGRTSSMQRSHQGVGSHDHD